MKEWYELVGNLETETPELDALAQKRIAKAALAALPKRRPRLKLAVIAAILVLLTACSAAVFRYTHWFEALTDSGAPTESEDLLAAMGTAIGQRQTVDGATVCLNGVLYDGATFLLSVSVEGVTEEGRYSSQTEPGKSWLYYSRNDWEDQWKDTVQPTLSYEQMVQSPLAQILLTRQFDMDRCLLLLEPLFNVQEGRELTLHLEDLVVMGQVVEGPFEFTFTPEKKEVSCTYTGEISLITASGEPYVLTEVVVTPLEIRAYICGVMDENGQPPQATPLIEEVRLSGDGWTWSPKASAQIDNGGDGTWNGCLRFGTLDRIIDPAAVTAVRIDDVWVELPQLTIGK